MARPGDEPAASLNLIMQVILAFLVFWRMVFIALGIAVVLAAFACALFGIESGGTACLIEDAAHPGRKLDAEERPLRRRGRHEDARWDARRRVAVSEATPALAWKFAGSHTEGAYTAVGNASTWSASLIPSFNTEALQDVAKVLHEGEGRGRRQGRRRQRRRRQRRRRERLQGRRAVTRRAARSGPGRRFDVDLDEGRDGYVKGLKGYDDWVGTPRLSMPLSLPVSAGEYDQLCGDAGKLVFDSFGELFDIIGLGGIGSVLSKAADHVQDIVSKSPQVFCAPIDKSTAVSDALDEVRSPSATPATRSS